MENINSKQLFEKSCSYIPGGVNSPVRAFGSVGSTPVFIKKATGSKLYDEDNNEYIDFIGAWGPAILGHSHPRVVEAVNKKLVDGFSYGLPTSQEAELAELINTAMPSIEMVRMTSSGTEAVMGAVRLARAFKQRKIILKFEGCYHGHSDAMLVKAGSGLLTNHITDSNGITEGVLQDTITLPYNDIGAIEEFFAINGYEVAAVIIEPVAANMGLVVPQKKYLERLREITHNYGALLIFDEVITGFRVGFGGAQEYFNIKPDLTILGKIIGGGLPAGAFGGRKDIMQMIAPLGNVYHAGTNSGNPISVTAGIETLNILMEDLNVYKQMETKAKTLCNKIKLFDAYTELDFKINHFQSLFTIFFTDKKVHDMNTAIKSNTEEYAKYFRFMLSKGIMLPPSQFEACFISTAHTVSDMTKTTKAIEEYFISRGK